MKVIAAISRVFLPMLLLTYAGCEPVRTTGAPPADHNTAEAPLCVYYAPVKIDILPLTEFVALDGSSEPHTIDTYVSLLDSFGSQIKSPGKFRFELYEYVQRSAEPKGRRVMIWPESDLSDPNSGNRYWTDLSDPAANNRSWRDFLRAYQFNLPFKPAPREGALRPGREYVLEATCLTPNGSRLTAEFGLKRRE
jgi:hypothetical protein